MRWIAALLAAVVGTCMGLAYGWILNPAGAGDTTPSSLRIDYRTDYVLMVAESFQATQDVESAKRQLAILGSRPPAETAAAAVQEARLAHYAPEDLVVLTDLARTLASSGSAVVPGDAPP
jgi:hypothetical protein